MVLFAASMTQDSDLSNSVKNGILYLEDPVDHEWLPHYFVLTNTNKLFYTEETNTTEQEEEEEDAPLMPQNEVCNDT